MTATFLAELPTVLAARDTPTGLASAEPVGVDLLPVNFDPTRDFFAACHTVTPPATYTPAYGPWRADRTLVETVAWLAYTLEGA